MKKQNKIINMLVPVVAVIVLVESVMLISNLNAKKQNDLMTDGSLENNALVSDNANEEQPVYRIIADTVNKEMNLARDEIVEVKAVGNSDRALDSISVYLKYDPDAFEVSVLTFDDKLPAPTFSKVSQSTGLIVANFLISEPEGLVVAEGEELTLMKFSAKPLKTGTFSFALSDGSEEKEAKTMFVESMTSKILPYLTEELVVNVSQ